MFQIEIIGEDKNCSRIVPGELGKICRLCLRKSGTVKLFDKKYKHNGGKFNELLSSLGLLDVEENDDLPQNICNSCASLINEFYFFKEQINASQIILNVALGKIHILIDKHQNPEDQIDQSQILEKEHIEATNEIKAEQRDSTDNLISDQINFNENKFSQNEDNKDMFIKEEFRTLDFVEPNCEELDFKPNLDEQTYLCSTCGKTFDHRNNFLRHRRSRKCIKVVCNICDKLIVKSRIRDHVNTHTKERPHVCEICGKSFHSRPNLYTHKVIHREDRPHICHLCGKAYKHAPQLTDHVRSHTQEYNFVCDLCGFISYTRTTFKKHQYQHSIKKDEIFVEKLGRPKPRTEYPRIKFCDICQREYNTYQRLAIHMRSHTGERPFKCKYCDKNFIQKSHLRCHIRLHTGEKPYVCRYCNKRFAINGNLTQHIQTHTGNRPHPCYVCNKSFYTNSSLRKHAIIHVKNEISEIV